MYPVKEWYEAAGLVYSASFNEEVLNGVLHVGIDIGMIDNKKIAFIANLCGAPTAGPFEIAAAVRRFFKKVESYQNEGIEVRGFTENENLKRWVKVFPFFVRDGFSFVAFPMGRG